MAISYVYSGEPMTGTSNDDFVIAFKGSTGTDNNTVNAGDGDDWVMADSSDTWIPSQSYSNSSIANAFSLETLTSTWTTSENPLFGDSSVPHTTVIAEATIGQSEYYGVQIGAGQKITIDLDFGAGSPIGNPRDMVVELQDSLGNIIVTADDSLVTDGGEGSLPSTPGSQSSYDPYLTYTVATAGTYYINVRPFGGGPGSTFTENNTFVLNVSVTGHTTGTSPVAGNDTINGEGGDDSLFGQGGADTINGGEGNDFIDGGSGGDVIHGGNGNDTIYGGDGTEENAHGDEGDDILHSGGEGHYYGDGGNDLIYAGLTSGVNEVLDGGDGVDTLDTTTWNGAYVIDLQAGTTNFGESFTNFEDVVTGNGADSITGTDGDNVITTNDGIDTVAAGGGDDTVAGGAGGDTLDGGDGSDTLDYRKSSGAVTISLAAGTASGGHADGDIISNFENISGSVLGDSLAGDANDNKLSGNEGNDTLTGAEGDDTLDGGINDDAMSGGIGDDTYYVDSLGDTVTEAAAEGTDTVITAMSYVLSDNVERLILSGAAAADGTGNALDNVLTGNAAINNLSGDVGNDTIAGGQGADVLDGGDGIDTLDYSTSAAAVSVSLAANTVSGGDAEGDVIANFENASGSASGDTLTGDANDNKLSGNEGNDTLTGADGNDTLDGGADDDAMSGGIGDDIFYVDSLGDTVTEAASEGIDTVNASVSFTLSDTVERLTLIGIAAIDGTGNSLDNILIGNAAANALSGEAGNDTIAGGAGADVLDGGGGIDTLDYSASAAGVTVSLGANTASGGDAEGDVISNFENIVTGAGDDNVTGSSAANVIRTNNGADTVAAGGGDDTVIAGSGADTLDGGDGKDTIDYSASTIALTVSLDGTPGGGGDAEGDILSHFEIVVTGIGNDIVSGNAAASTIKTGAGADTVIAGDGNDVVAGGTEGDSLDGGDGIDTLDYTSSAAGVTISLAANSAAGGDAEGDVIANFENVSGSAGIDSLTGNSAANQLRGNDGADTLTGNGGKDVLNGGAGTDAMAGGAGNDTYFVDDAGDTVTESASAGKDLVRSSITFKLSANIEKLRLDGSSAIDATGNGLANVLTGNAADNTLSGAGGKDRLTGGAGDDVFLFRTAINASSLDHITDFKRVDDTIELENAIFGALKSTGTLAKGAFHASTSGVAHDASDRILYETDTGKLFYDRDGNGSHAATLFAVLDGKPGITHSDFHIV